MRLSAFRSEHTVVRKVRGLLAHSPAIAISTLALVFALGSGAGYAASTANGATTPVFHNLPLGKGWVGQLKYTIINGVVYLSGNANGNSRKTIVMTTLPRGARPTSSQQDIPITFGGEGDGVIQLLNTGQIAAFAPAGGDYSFVSLSGVSFALGS